MNILKIYNIFVFIIQAILYSLLFLVTEISVKDKDIFNVSFFLLEKSILLLYLGIFIVFILLFYFLYKIILNKNNQNIKDSYYIFFKQSLSALILYIILLCTFLFLKSAFFQSYSICYNQPGHCDIRSKEFPIINPADIPSVIQ
jgi:hypothetical protein